MKKIIFISEIQDPETQGSSTQIMTRNILEGFKDNNFQVIFIAITDRDCNDFSVRENFKNLVDEIIIVKSQLELRFIKGKFNRLIKMIKSQYFYKLKNKLIEKIEIETDDLLITHTPSIEAILIANKFKEKNNNVEFIQYWSDPLALSGIYPEDLNIKRYIHFRIERKLLKSADKIVYGTKTLFLHQKKLFMNYKNRMSYIDVSYQSTNIDTLKKHVEKYTIGYTGQYQKSTRNIEPLYNVFKSYKEADLLICGNGDISLEETSNIKVINKRYSQNQIGNIEKEIDVIVGLLNSNCIQIPGKIFYHTHTNKSILVILDGKYSNQIYEYLKSFNRFVFCENNEDSIKKALNKIISIDYKVNKDQIKYLSPKYISLKLSEGGY